MRVSTIHTDDPLGVALVNMGRAARDASRSFTLQEWASRLAAKAPPRDYVGQLRELYGGIIKRWRYVMEPGERVPGSGRAVLRYTLGAGYNCADPERCDVEATPWRSMGWGDCDDVSTLAAAGVLALGMSPVWRVVRWPGGAHVSVLARTPRGRVVSLDPVGHPSHGFGWRMDPPAGDVQTFDLDGRPVAGFERRRTGAQPMGTYLAGVDQYTTARRARVPHLVALHPLAPRGPRLLAVPPSVHRAMLRGEIVDRAPAVDQYGQRYEYMSGADMWAPMDGRRSRRLARRRRRRVTRSKRRAARLVRRKKRREKVRRVVRRIREGVARVAGKISRSKLFTFLRKIKSRIMASPLVQGLASSALSIFGIPPQATKAILQREADIAKKGGRSRLIELVASGKLKDAGRFMRDSFGGVIKQAKGMLKRAGASSFLSGPPPWCPWYTPALAGGMDDEAAGVSTYCYQNGQTIPAAYVAGFYPAMGQAEAMDVRTEPTPGAWYQIQRGDSLIGVAGRAYGLGAGGARLRAAQRINAAPYNFRFHDAPTKDFDRRYFSDGIVSFLPKFGDADAQRLDEAEGAEDQGNDYAAIWIPSETQPDAPPMAVDEPETVTPEPAEPEDELPEDVPEVATPPEGFTCPPGVGPKYVAPFFNELTQKQEPASWVCSVAPTPPYQVCPPEGGPGYCEQAQPEPSPEEPPAPVMPTSPIEPIPDARPPLCPPGFEPFWPSGAPGFGMHECRPVAEPSPEEPPAPVEPAPMPVEPMPVEPEPMPVEPMPVEPEPMPVEPSPEEPPTPGYPPTPTYPPQPQPGAGRGIPAPFLALALSWLSQQ